MTGSTTPKIKDILPIKDGHFVFATVQASFDDDPVFAEKLDQVLESIGFSAGDPSQYI